MSHTQKCTPLEGVPVVRKYLENCLKYPIPMRMIKGHIHKLVGPWLSEFTDLRDMLNMGGLDVQGLLDKLVSDLEERVKHLDGRTTPIPTVIDRLALKTQREEAMKAAIAEQEAEAAALAALDAAAACQADAGAGAASTASEDASSAAPEAPAYLTKHQRNKQRRKMGLGLASSVLAPVPGAGDSGQVEVCDECEDVSELLDNLDLFGAADISQVVTKAGVGAGGENAREVDSEKGELVTYTRANIMSSKAVFNIMCRPASTALCLGTIKAS
eukprot:gene20225-26978_t